MVSTTGRDDGSLNGLGPEFGPCKPKRWWHLRFSELGATRKYLHRRAEQFSGFSNTTNWQDTKDVRVLAIIIAPFFVPPAFQAPMASMLPPQYRDGIVSHAP
jgi:hypothetical protein